MFNINIQQQKYAFPTIDFKLQNVGNATALLWRFVLHVKEIEVDITPTLEFYVGVDAEGALHLEAMNNGWGTAHNISLHLEEIEENGYPYWRVPSPKKPCSLQTLNRLFAPIIQTYRATLQSGERATVFRLGKDFAEPQQFKAVVKEFTNLSEGEQYSVQSSDMIYDGLPLYGVKLGAICISWACEDEQGMQHTGECLAVRHEMSADKPLVLTEKGFQENISVGESLPLLPSSVYVSMIDPTRGVHELTYSLSHKIPPGDVERFHILVGALQSCSLRLSFTLFVDPKTTLDSEEFCIHIWSPRGFLTSDGFCQKDSTYYRDNTQLLPPYLKEQSVIELEKWYADYVAKKPRSLSMYPFFQVNTEQ